VTRSEIRAVAWTGPLAPAFPRFLREKGLNGVAVTTKKPVVCHDVANDPRYLTAFASTGSEAIFPIVSEVGEVIGTIDIESDRQMMSGFCGNAPQRCVNYGNRYRW